MNLNNISFEKLTKSHQALVDDFCCVESDNMLSEYKSSHRKRIIKHSQDIDNFFKHEASEEQDNGYSTTLIFINILDLIKQSLSQKVIIMIDL